MVPRRAEGEQVRRDEPGLYMPEAAALIQSDGRCVPHIHRHRNAGPAASAGRILARGHQSAGDAALTMLGMDREHKQLTGAARRPLFGRQEQAAHGQQRPGPADDGGESLQTRQDAAPGLPRRPAQDGHADELSIGSTDHGAIAPLEEAVGHHGFEASPAGVVVASEQGRVLVGEGDAEQVRDRAEIGFRRFTDVRGPWSHIVEV